MVPSRLIFFFCMVIGQIISAISLSLPHAACLDDAGNFTRNSSYSSNLYILLTSIAYTSEFDNGFNITSFGQIADRVNAITLCRGDTNPEASRSYLHECCQALRQLCPDRREAVCWYEDCMLRYSNRTISGSMEFYPLQFGYYQDNLTEVYRFNMVLDVLFANLTDAAASGNSHKKFAVVNMTVSGKQNVYAMAQCTPDLSKDQCTDCLTMAIDHVRECCNRSIGAYVFAASCFLKYEDELFFNPQLTMVPLPPPPPPLHPTLAPPPPTSIANPNGRKRYMFGTVSKSIFLMLILS